MRTWERFISKVDKTETCWNWTASLSEAGYGQFFVSAKRWKSHRFAYTELVGPIPEGLELDHLCRNRACCNPEHLEPVTRRENQKRGLGPTARNIDVEECKRGHRFDEENTFRRRDGHRACRICMRIREANRPPRKRSRRRAGADQ